MKFYKWKYNFYLLILLLLIVVAGAEEKCPPACTCHESYFSELPLYRFLQDGPQPEEVPSHYHNNAMYEDTPPALENNAILRMAMCVFTSGSEPGMLLSMLSPDLQALTILQGRDSGEIALEAEHMAQLQQLEVLEIHGFYHDTSNHSDNEVPQTESETGKLVLRNDALRALTSLKYLNLQHVKLLGHPSQGNRASPAYFPLDPNSNEISANFGMHQEFRKLKGKGKKEKELALHRLVFLPPSDGEGDILPYKVYVEQQEKAGLSTFTGLTNLLFIRVYRCNLREINWEMFDGLHNLQYLSLEGNHLLFIPDFAFLGTPNLQTLSLAHNQLLSLQSTSLAGLFELEKLDLSHNNFSHLSELSLPPFPNLRLADFRQNPIESVFASTFEIMNATLTLLIGGEESSLNIQPNSFLGLVNLRKLNIFNIGIANLERELLRGMPKLKELEVSGSIESLSFDAFLEVPKLEKLILKNCGISSISMDAFYALYGLLYLDLSNNLLDSLPPGLFDQQFSLKELLLQNNKLTRLPPGFFTNVPAKMIRLEGNPWHCTCAMKDWQPSAINKVKQKGTFDQCQFRYDKGSMCNLTVSMDRYVYDKRVAPRCTTPSKFKNWSVFQVLRKELRCNSKSHYKMDRKAYLKQKFEDYEKSVKPVYHGTKKIFKYYPNKDTKISKENKSSKNNSVMSTIQQTAPVHTDTNPTSEENVTSVLITKQNFTNIEPANPSENLNTDTDPSLIDLPKDLHASTNTEINSVVDPNPIDLPKENSSTDLPTNQQLVNSSVNIPTGENSVVDSITTSAPTRPTTNKPLNEAVNKTQGKMETPIPTTERNTISANHKKLPEETNLPLTSPVMSTLVTNSTSASSTSMPPSTIEVPIRKPEVISQSFSGNITSTNFPSTTTRKSNDNDPSLYSLNPFPIGKKEKKLKIDLLREIMERSESQEIHKKPGPSNSIAPSNFITGNGTPNKISKKAWKLEMERKRQEKLKRYQGQNI